MNPFPWLRSDGRFNFRSCAMISKYIEHKTGHKMKVYKSGRTLVCPYVKDGKLVVQEIPIPEGVLYCIDEAELKPLVDDLQNLPYFS